MKKTAFYLLAAALLPVCLSCNGSGTTGPVVLPSAAPDFFGSVYDSHGMPAQGVAVHYIPHLSGWTGPLAILKTTPVTTISFLLPRDGIVTMTMYRYGSNELIATLIDHQKMFAGMQEVSSDMSRFTNGIYRYIVALDGTMITDRIMLFLPAPDMRYINHLEGTTGLTVTGIDGKFSLPHSVFGIGLSFKNSDENGEIIGITTISDTIDLVLMQTGHQPFVRQVVVDTSRVYHGTFMLPAGTAE